LISSARATRALSELTRSDVTPKQLDNLEVLGRVAELLDRKLFDATIVNEIITMATRPGDLAGTLDAVLSILRRFVAYDVAAIALVNERKMAVHFESPISREDLDEFRRLAVGHLQQMSGLMVSPDDIKLWLARRPSFSDFDPAEGWPSFFAMALRSRGEVFGTLAVASHKPGVYTPQVARTLRMVEFPIAAVVDAASHHQRLLEQEARLSLSSLYGDPDV
jgi:transcriptional regulator with GAF, ATPase, and Fis domain